MERILAAIENVVMGTFMVSAIAVGFMQVVLRYVFNTGFPWTEGILITLTVWAALIGGSRAVRDGLHVRVEVFAESLPSVPRRWVGFAAHLVSFLFCLVLAVCGVLYTRFVWQMGAMSLDAYIPEWAIFAVVPVSMTAFVLRYLQILWRLAAGVEEAGRDLEQKIARSL